MTIYLKEYTGKANELKKDMDGGDPQDFILVTLV